MLSEAPTKGGIAPSLNWLFCPESCATSGIDLCADADGRKLKEGMLKEVSIFSFCCCTYLKSARNGTTMASNIVHLETSPHAPQQLQISG